jgi:hypothetical protein
MDLEKADYYFDQNGNVVFTKEYHLKRGYCCKNGCKHCPWEYLRNKNGKTVQKK